MTFEVLDRWCHKGIKCAVRYQTTGDDDELDWKDGPEMGHYCGYVKVPDEIKQDVIKHEKEIKVHGGITFGSHGDNIGLCDGYWIGFDTAHDGDVNLPGYDWSSDVSGSHEWDLEVVKEETNNLAEEILKLYPDIVKEVSKNLDENKFK